MEKLRRNEKESSVKVFDIFIIAMVLLTVIAVIGQGVAVYFVNKANSTEDFLVAFEVVSLERADAEKLEKAQTAAEGGLEVRSRDMAGQLDELSFVAEDNDAVSHLCRLSGVFSVKGKTKAETVSLYGYGNVENGDVLLIYIDNFALAAEIKSITAVKM